MYERADRSINPMLCPVSCANCSSSWWDLFEGARLAVEMRPLCQFVTAWAVFVERQGAYQLRHTTQSYTPAKSRQCLSDGGLGALLESVGKTTLSASLSVLVPSHEDTGTTGGGGAWESVGYFCDMIGCTHTLGGDAGSCRRIRPCST